MLRTLSFALRRDLITPAPAASAAAAAAVSMGRPRKRDFNTLTSDVTVVQSGVVEVVQEEPPPVLISNHKKAMLERGIQHLTGQNTVFISIDLEWWERMHKGANPLLEVGMAIYEPSGNLVPCVHYEHYIIKENQARTNGRFVSDHKYHCSFTTSKVIPLEECKRAYRRIIQGYERRAEERGQQVMYVGHNIAGDIAVLKREGFYIGKSGILDTMTAWEASGARFSALHKIMKYLGLPHGLLHNATNDAHATLMVALSIFDPQFRKKKGLDNVPLEVEAGFYPGKEKANITAMQCKDADHAVKVFYESQGYGTVEK